MTIERAQTFARGLAALQNTLDRPNRILENETEIRVKNDKRESILPLDADFDKSGASERVRKALDLRVTQ